MYQRVLCDVSTCHCFLVIAVWDSQQRIYPRRMIQGEVFTFTLWSLVLENYSNAKDHGRQYLGDSSSMDLVPHMKEPGIGKEVE